MSEDQSILKPSQETQAAPLKTINSRGRFPLDSVAVVGGVIACLSMLLWPLFVVIAPMGGLVAYVYGRHLDSRAQRRASTSLASGPPQKSALRRAGRGAMIGAGALVLLAVMFSPLQHASKAAAEKKALAALRETDPKAYLARIKTVDRARFLKEYEILDPAAYPDAYIALCREEKDVGCETEALRRWRPQEYQALLARLAAEEDARKLDADRAAAARKAEIRRMLKEGKELSAEERWSLYAQLVDLGDRDQATTAALDRAREAMNEEIAQRSDPAAYLDVKADWENLKGIMLARFTITSRLNKGSKDFAIACRLFAPSGAVVNEVETVVFERAGPRGRARSSELNLGFVNAQAQTAQCRVTGARFD